MFRQHSLNSNNSISKTFPGQKNSETPLESQMKVQRYMHLRRTKSEAMMDEIGEKDKAYVLLDVFQFVKMIF